MHISPNQCYCLHFLYCNIESWWMCVHAFCVDVKRHAPLCPLSLSGLKKAVKKTTELGRERVLEREDGRATRRRAPGWKGEPEVVSQPAFKSSPLGLTEPMTIHSVSPSVLLPTLSPGPSSWKSFLVFFLFFWGGFETMKKDRRSRRDQRGNEVGRWTMEGSFGFCRKHENACLSDRLSDLLNEDEQHTSYAYVHPRAEEDKSV